MTTESDRELLELAARAYWGGEIDDVCSIRWLEQDQAIGYTHGDNQDHNGQDREFVWNPLTNDGDALRLLIAIKGELSVWSGSSAHGACTTIDHDEFTMVEPHGSDAAAATRRIITRAAAEIARATHKEGA